MKQKMKLVAGMGSIEDYPDFIKAGAEEIFIGYVPFSWMKKHGIREALNRREVIYYNVQIGAYSELQILQDMKRELEIPVSIAMNSLSYKEENYPELMEMMRSCMTAGFSDFIVADASFLAYIWSKEKESFCPNIIISGEYGELNERIVAEFADHKVKRIIFPRQTSITEMSSLIQKFPSLEYEAFALNEKCHYTGAYCNSVHCDAFCHMCKVPYACDQAMEVIVPERDYTLPGETGCGLCALWQLQGAGVTHLKVVSRGNSSEATREDLEILQKALAILEQSASQEEYIQKMKKTIFPQECSGNCYYLE